MAKPLGLKQSNMDFDSVFGKSTTHQSHACMQFILEIIAATHVISISFNRSLWALNLGIVLFLQAACGAVQHSLGISCNRLLDHLCSL